jgi:proline dehydrogenase
MFQEFGIFNYPHKSLGELKKSIFVYKIITRPFMLKLGNMFIKLALKTGLPLKIFTGFIFRQFSGGENLQAIQNITDKLAKFNVYSIPDYSVEADSGHDTSEEVIKEIIKTIDLAVHDKNIPFAVFKPTGITKPELLEQNQDENSLHEFRLKLDKIFSYAAANSIPVLTDAEDYKYQNSVDQVVLEMMKKYNRKKAIVFTTLQMYRKDRLDYLRYLLSEAKSESFILGIKFVRGAYLEKEREEARLMSYPSPVFETKQDTDNAFDEAIKLSVENNNHINIFCGTHNADSIYKLTMLMSEHNIPAKSDGIWFSQLYGMRDNLTFVLAEKGYNVAKYLPYAPIRKLIPYLLRRAEENSSINAQAMQEIEMMKAELKVRQRI